jgi:hypothetical protein
MSGNSNPGDRTIYTNSYTTATRIIITMTVAIAYVDAIFQKNKWVKEGESNDNVGQNFNVIG